MEQELNFTVELTMDWAYRFLMQFFFSVFFFSFTLPFLCHALNFMTAGSRLEYYLPSNSPLLSLFRGLLDLYWNFPDHKTLISVCCD